MSKQPERGEDRDPAPLQHVDAERATDDEAAKVPSSEDAGDLQEDPARNPPDGPLRDVKGG